VLARLTQDYAVSDVPLERLAGFAIAEHRGGNIGWGVAEAHEDLGDHVVAEIRALGPRDG